LDAAFARGACEMGCRVSSSLFLSFFSVLEMVDAAVVLRILMWMAITFFALFFLRVDCIHTATVI
jgi:hypothetical protein